MMRKFYKYLLSLKLSCLTLLCFGQQNGIITTQRSAPVGLVSFTQASNFTGVSNAHHVDGYVKKYGPGVFVFPVGNKGSYMPFVADAENTVGAYFKENAGAATLPAGGPYATSNKETALNKISTTEFWDINGTNSTRITLSWKAESNVTDLTDNSLAKIGIAGWNAATSRWENLPALVDAVSVFGGASTLATGSVTTVSSLVPNSYSIFTLASTVAAPAQANFAGTFEDVNCSEITGWAWDQNYPNAALTLELVEGTTVHATFTASSFREDLKNAGTGTGNYGFSLPLPVNLRDGNAHELSVRVRGSIFTLTGATKTVKCGYEGSFESADCYSVKGWVRNRDYPDSRLEVELMEGNVVYATSIANIHRADLQNSGIGSGNYGFSIAIPAGLRNSQTRRISIRIKGSSYLTSGSPKDINCSPSLYYGNFDGGDCNMVKGWVWDINYPANSHVVELFEGATVYATATANINRPDVRNAGYGTGNYGFSINIPDSLKNGIPRHLSVRIKESNYLLTGSPKSLTCTGTIPLFESRFESIDCNLVRGWIWDKNSPNSSFDVELLEGTTVYALATANIYRPDLKNAGYGTGNNGFSFPTPQALKNGQTRQLSVRVKDTNYLLTGSPKTVSCIDVVIPLYAGSFDAATCNSIEGWAWDKNNPAEALTLELVEGTIIHATTIANTYRSDLKNAGYGTGNYGFSMVVPKSLKDGQPRQLSVRIKNTNYTLDGSPKNINCMGEAIPLLAGGFDGADCNTVRGWAWDKSNPTGALTVELLEGNTVLATTIANVYRADLKTAGLGTGNYGFSISAPQSLKNGQQRQLSVRIQNTTYILAGSPRNINCIGQVISLYAGGFDGADCNTIRGWAWDKSNPTSALTVELLEGNTVLATGIANIYRTDLKTAGVGTGNYGFSIPVPLNLKNGQQRQLSVRIQNTTYILEGSPRNINCVGPVLSIYAGGFDGADCNTVRGWAWDKSNPTGALTVELLEGNTVYATTIANAYRADLKTAGLGTGNYGFSISIPQSLKNGQQRQLAVRIQNTTYILGGSPRNINCIGQVISLYAGGFDGADCNTIRGWAWDKSNPTGALTVEIMEGNTVLATGIANIYRTDLKTAGVGTGNYGFSIPVPLNLKNGQQRQLSVRIQNTTYILEGSPRNINCVGPVLSIYAGGFDGADCNTVRGWAWDKNNPAGALTLELVEGTTVHATGIANIYRADLKNAGYGTGNYGFSIPVPESLKNGQPRQLSVRVKNGNYTLGSAKTITCNSSARLGVQDGGDQKPNETPGRLLTVSPNPTDGVIQIGFEQVANKRATISIVNMLGRAVWEKVMIGTGKPEKVTADLREQADGIYLVQMKTGEKIQVRRILLVK